MTMQVHASKSKLNNSPFRYPGGKFYARKLIMGEIPQHETYCEPFAGGASVFFAKPLAGHSVLNDLDSEVINTFRQIKDRVEDLIGLLKGVEASKQNHAYYKNEYRPSNDLEKAFRWYYLNRTSYSGIMKPENCYWGYGHKYSMGPDNWPPHLRTVSDKLQGVEIMSADFESVIDGLPDDSFMFVDPPYYDTDQHKFYNHTFTLKDHQRLNDCLKRNSSRLLFLLTYDRHPDVRKMYNWADTVNDKTWNYAISRTGRPTQRHETQGTGSVAAGARDVSCS